MFVIVIKLFACSFQVIFIRHSHQIVSLGIGETFPIADYNVRVNFVGRSRFHVEVTNADFHMGFRFFSA